MGFKTMFGMLGAILLWTLITMVGSVIAAPTIHGTLFGREGATGLRAGYTNAPSTTLDVHATVITMGDRTAAQAINYIQTTDSNLDNGVKMWIRNCPSGACGGAGENASYIIIESSDEIELRTTGGTIIQSGGFVLPKGTDPTVCITLHELYLDTDGSANNTNCASATTDPNLCICTATGTPGVWHPIE